MRKIGGPDRREIRLFGSYPRAPSLCFFSLLLPQSETGKQQARRKKGYNVCILYVVDGRRPCIDIFVVLVAEMRHSLDQALRKLIQRRLKRSTQRLRRLQKFEKSSSKQSSLQPSFTLPPDDLTPSKNVKALVCCGLRFRERL